MPFKHAAASALVALVCLSVSADAATVSDALIAYRANQVAEAEALLEAIVGDAEAPPEERGAAARELSRIDWLVRGETDGVERILTEATTDEDRCTALILALRIYREAGTPRRALDYAEHNGASCAQSSERALRLGLARAHLALAARDAAGAGAHLSAAASELATMPPIALRDPQVAATRLSLALSQHDADAAVTAWRDYFWLDSADAPQAMQAYAGRVAAILSAGLVPNARDEERAVLVDMLIRAGFAADARALAGEMNEGDQWRRARAYFAFRDTVTAETLAANRAMATGEDASAYTETITEAINALMRDAGLEGDPSAALRDAYGLYGTLGETSGYPSLHAGHLVQRETIEVAQYGRSGALGFVVIDNVIANGFESWLWDGWAETGGWSGSDGTIVQVRSAYTSGPLASLARTRPGPARERALARIETESTSEREALTRDPLSPLPATGARLELQALEAIAEHIGADDAALIAEIWRATVQYSIILHEGRHALDNAAGEFSSADLEFRAKLSQIALADNPRLGLANVAQGSQADTAHGQANRRVLDGYRRWMQRHRREITGYDRREPTLSQLHLLTDAQIRAVARALDPWAN